MQANRWYKLDLSKYLYHFLKRAFWIRCWLGFRKAMKQSWSRYAVERDIQIDFVRSKEWEGARISMMPLAYVIIKPIQMHQLMPNYAIFLFINKCNEKHEPGEQTIENPVNHNCQLSKMFVKWNKKIRSLLVQWRKRPNKRAQRFRLLAANDVSLSNNYDLYRKHQMANGRRRTKKWNT